MSKVQNLFQNMIYRYYRPEKYKHNELNLRQAGEN
jgi:hypothetical protein